MVRKAMSSQGISCSRNNCASIVSGERSPGLLETSVPGIFVVGDVRRGSVKRVASGVGEGSVAVQFIHQYLAEVGA